MCSREHHTLLAARRRPHLTELPGRTLELFHLLPASALGLYLRICDRPRPAAQRQWGHPGESPVWGLCPGTLPMEVLGPRARQLLCPLSGVLRRDQVPDRGAGWTHEGAGDG